MKLQGTEPYKEINKGTFLHPPKLIMKWTDGATKQHGMKGTD
jgi:hypothetical protein